MHALRRRELLAAAAALPIVAYGSEPPSRAGASAGAGALPSHAQALGHAIAALRTTPVPSPVAERLAWTLLDGVAVMRYSSRLHASEPFVRSLSDRVGTPAASVPALRLTLAAENAAAVNAFLLHATEIDDSDLRGQLRASSVVLPAILAMAEAVDCSGTDFVRAASLAYSVQGRLSTPLQPRGWMSAGVFGPPAAAAAAAFLMDQPAAVIASAIGLAGSASSGLFQYYYDQTEDKRIIVARGARIAVESARLAALGEVGPPRIVEGRAGLYPLFAGSPAPDAAVLTTGLDALEGPLYLRPKFHSASQSIIPTLDGLAEDLPPDFRPDDVEFFVVRGDKRFGDTIGEKIQRYERPATVMGAMLNYNFAVAMYLVRRSVMPSDYPVALADERIHRFAALARFEASAPPDALDIEFRMRDGRRHLVHARKHGRHEPAPLDRERRLQKFAALSSDLEPAARQRMLDLCLQVDTARSMRQWMGQLARAMSD